MRAIRVACAAVLLVAVFCLNGKFGVAALSSFPNLYHSTHDVYSLIHNGFIRGADNYSNFEHVSWLIWGGPRFVNLRFREKQRWRTYMSVPRNKKCADIKGWTLPRAGFKNRFAIISGYGGVQYRWSGGNYFTRRGLSYVANGNLEINPGILASEDIQSSGEDIQGKPGALLGSHLVQLRMDRLVGTVQSAPLKSSNYQSSSRKRGDPYRSVGRAARRAILCCFFLLLGFVSMKGAYWCLDHPAPPICFRIAGWLGWCIGFVAVGYGTILGLSLLNPIPLLDSHFLFRLLS